MGTAENRSGRSAMLVAAGIMASRVVGLLRQGLLSHFFGNGVAAGAFNAAMRIPNFLQTLLGEAVLSASLIPVYAGLRAQKRDEEADQLASVTFGLLAVVVAVAAAVGVWAAPGLVTLIVPGFVGASYELTVTLVRIIFPGTGVLVLSAWCLAILNSHRRFFLSYVASVLWNGAIIAALLWGHGGAAEQAIVWAAWGSVVGSVLQFLVQLPTVMAVLGGLRPQLTLSLPSLREVLRGFFPAVTARGVVQISAYVDSVYGSLISERAVAAIANAQTIWLLPISLFGMSISAAELPEMASEVAGAGDERYQKLIERLALSLERVAFFVVPSAAALLLLGDVIAGLLLQSGHFTAAETRYVWLILMGASVGLLAQTSGRLYSSAFYALKDTKTPQRVAMFRVAVSASIGFVAVQYLPDWLQVPAHLAAIFVTATTGISAWLEMALLRRALRQRVGALPSMSRRLAQLWVSALVAGAATLSVKYALGVGFGSSTTTEWSGAVLPMPALHPRLIGVPLLALFGTAYLIATWTLGVPQARGLVAQVLRRKHRST